MAAHLEPEDTVAFHCRACGHRFKAAPGAVTENSAAPWHPWAYSADCPRCDAEAEPAAWWLNLLKAYANSTGPTTPEGIRRTRFNRMTHGLTAKVATHWPARPGQYDHCNGCRHLEDLECLEFGGCLTRTELLLRHLMAFEARDPGLLQGLAAERQAKVAALLDDMLLSIVRRGVDWEIDDWYSDKDGGFHLAEYVDEETGQKIRIKKQVINGLLKPFMDWIQKNGMTLTDQGMTPKVQEDNAVLEGQLADESDARDSQTEYAERQTKALENLAGMIEASRAELERDPILREHRGIEEKSIEGEVVADG